MLIYTEPSNPMLQAMQSDDNSMRELMWIAAMSSESYLHEYASNMAKIMEYVTGHWYIGPFGRFYRVSKLYGPNRDKTAFGYWNPVPVSKCCNKYYLYRCALYTSFSGESQEDRIDFLTENLFSDLNNYKLYLQYGLQTC